ncbi:MAG: FKBP-type peptidyl-prolyl cis-trans isomerase [Bacteroidota bacterium]
MMRQLIVFLALSVLFVTCKKDTPAEAQGTTTLTSLTDSVAYAMSYFYAEEFAKLNVKMNATQMAAGMRNGQSGQVSSKDPGVVEVMERFQKALADRRYAPFADGQAVPFPIDSVSYGIGVGFGEQMNAQGIVLSPEAYYQGFADQLAGIPSKVGNRGKELQQELNFMILEKTDPQQVANLRAEMAKGTAFVAQKAKTTDLLSTASGLHYEILQAGSGASPGPTDRVTVHYHGTLTDGTIFDSSVNRGQPATFGLNQVIAGWTEGVQLMQEGAKYRFYIPQNLAYGTQGSPPNIPGGATLIFEIELLSIGG